jgi:hypothetical protein
MKEVFHEINDKIFCGTESLKKLSYERKIVIENERDWHFFNNKI